MEVKDPNVDKGEEKDGPSEAIVYDRVRCVLAQFYVVNWGQVPQELHQKVDDKDGLDVPLAEPVVDLEDVYEDDTRRY